jgi:hypothetical protein
MNARPSSLTRLARWPDRPQVVARDNRHRLVGVLRRNALDRACNIALTRRTRCAW